MNFRNILGKRNQRGRETILYNSMYVKFWKIQTNLYDRKISNCLGIGRGERGLKAQESFEGDGNSCYTDYENRLMDVCVPLSKVIKLHSLNTCCVGVL